MFRTCIVLAVLAWTGAARAERAILECVADTSIARGDRAPRGASRTLHLSVKGGVALAFRTGAIDGWRLQQVVLLLHVANGEAPYRVRAGAIARPWSESAGTGKTIPRPKTRWRRVRTYTENWIAIDLTAEEARAPGVFLSGAEALLDARESAGFAPYLMVEGVSPAGSQPGPKQPPPRCSMAGPPFARVARARGRADAPVQTGGNRDAPEPPRRTGSSAHLREIARASTVES